MKLIVVRDGSALLFSEFGTQHVNVGDVVILAAQTLCGAEPEGSVTTTTVYLDRDYVVDQVFWQYAAQFSDREDARDCFEACYTAPAQVFRIGESRTGLMPWLDELTALSAGGSLPARFLRAQALLSSVMDVISPFISAEMGHPSGQKSNAVVPSVPRHRQFSPLRVEAQEAAQRIHAAPGHRWSVRELAEIVHFTLGVALAAIALLVGAVGITNTMVVTVLERRGEIGLRRSLGARPSHISIQFLTEAACLALIAGIAGLALGIGAATALALISGQPLVIPVETAAASPGIAVIVGAVAGLYPALRAAKLSPTLALRAT